jgi:hypothetical protein
MIVGMYTFISHHRHITNRRLLFSDGQEGRSAMDLARRYPTVVEALESAARNTQYVLK